MTKRIFIGFEVTKETKQLFYCRKKKQLDYETPLRGSFLTRKSLENREMLGAHCLTENPTLKELQERKEEIWAELVRLVPNFSKSTAKPFIDKEILIGL